MIRRRMLIALIALSVAVQAALAVAQTTSTGMISNSVANRAGLERAWYTTVEVDPSRDGVESVTQFTESYVVYDVIDHYGRLHTFSERDLDGDGNPIGKGNAKLRADEFAAKLNLSPIGDPLPEKEQVKVTERIVASVLLMAQTKLGTIHAIDGETGRTLWARQVGKRSYPTMPAAANRHFVATLNGSTLYVLDRRSGETLSEKRVGGAVGSGPALTETMAFVPLAGGMLEGYALDDTHVAQWKYKAAGRSYIQPIVTPESIAWPTDLGHLCVASSKNPAIRFRLQTRDAINSQPAYHKPLLIVASGDGYVYGVHEVSGETVWRIPTGMLIDEPPAAVGDAAYVFPRKGGVFKLDAANGKTLWRHAAAARFLAASDKRLYALDVAGRSVVLDVKTGALLGRIDTSRLDLSLVNQQTDRIYLGTRSGLIQCLREIGRRTPMLHQTTAPTTPPVTTRPAEEKPGTETKPADEKPPAADPFGKPPADNPFGEPPAEKPSEEPPAENPFGA